MLRRILGRKSEAHAVVAPKSLAAYRYAAVDVETTGLYPGGHDRVIEIAIVSFSLDGGVEEEYHTLLNPNRDIGAVHIHGLSMADLVHAPRFTDIAPDIVRRLRDRVIVAHNAGFDARFLEVEFTNAGLPIPALPYLCTMRLVSPGGFGRRLTDVCGRLGVEHTDRHTALGDARAVASVFTRWHGADPSRRSLTLAESGCHEHPEPQSWPDLTGSHPPIVRSAASRIAADDRGYLERLIEEMPDVGVTNSASDAVYLDLLERALEDRHMSREEADQLVRFAADEGLGTADVRRLHEEFFAAMVEKAWEDGRLSRLEIADVRLVGEFLGIDPGRVDEAVTPRQPASAAAPSPPAALVDQDSDDLTITAGMSVCFTGALRATIYGQGVSREQAQELARRAGLVVLENVTKKLDILVVADPLSVSGKAKKAREYGTRIVAEPVFWKALGVDFD